MQTYDHTERRDELMRAARVLKDAIERTKRGEGKPRQRWATPGTVQIMRDCVRLARVQNRLAMEERRYIRALS